MANESKNRYSRGLSVLKKIVLPTFVASNLLYLLRKWFPESFKKITILFFNLLMASTSLQALLNMHSTVSGDVHGSCVGWRKALCSRFWVLNDSTHSGDHSLRVSKKSHFWFSLCRWPQNGPLSRHVTPKPRCKIRKIDQNSLRNQWKIFFSKQQQHNGKVYLPNNFELLHVLLQHCQAYWILILSSPNTVTRHYGRGDFFNFQNASPRKCSVCFRWNFTGVSITGYYKLIQYQLLYSYLSNLSWAANMLQNHHNPGKN